MKSNSGKKRLVSWLVCAALTLLALGCFAALAWLGRLLPPQDAAARWQGSSELRFTQLSCYLPVNEKLDRSQVYQFRSDMAARLHEAAMDVENDEQLWRDAWSVSGKAVASTELGRGDASVIAVGGDFFQFHPLRLLSGNYIAEGDLMQDRVLLDEELAWLLFGGTQLQGLPMQIDGQNFVVAGVVRREQDFASKKAYTDGMGLYMSYDAYAALHEEDGGAGIDCYELVIAEPVKGFALNFAREKFPIADGVILQNTGRFAFGKLFGIARQFGQRSMQQTGLRLPYWENAARCAEDWGALLALCAVLLLLYPGFMLVLLLVRLFRRGRDKLKEDLVPAWKDKAEEAVQVRRRRAWERRRGQHER